VSFGVMTGFAVCGALYDTTNVEENVKAFKAMALILMVSRLALVGQYGVVLFFVRKFRKTTWPLLLTMVALFVGAMVYLGTVFGFPDSAADEASFPIEHGKSNTYIAWCVFRSCYNVIR
jgi:cytochrome bd-type quinol oxidase subunit 2